MTTTAREILDRATFYRRSPVEMQAKFLAAARVARLEPGQLLLREADIANSFSVVARGSIRVFRIGSTGREITLYHVHDQQSSLVAMMSALLETPAVATAQAEVQTELVVLPAAAFREWIRTSDELRAFVFGTMTRALVDVTTVLEDVAFRSVDSRLAAFLVSHAGAGDVIAMRHEDIATELGTAREVVSRILESHERAGAIALTRGRVAIVDQVKLRGRE